MVKEIWTEAKKKTSKQPNDKASCYYSWSYFLNKKGDLKMAEFVHGFDDYKIDPNKLNDNGVFALRDAIIGNAIDDYVRYTIKSKKIANILKNPLTTYSSAEVKDDLRYRYNAAAKKVSDTNEFFESDFFQNLTQGVIDMEALRNELEKRVADNFNKTPFGHKGVHVPKVKSDGKILKA